MAEVINRRLNIYIDQAGAEAALEKLTKKENDLVAAIEKGKKSGKDLTKEMNDLAATRGKIGELSDVISGKVLPSIRQAEAAVTKLRRELKGLPADSAAAGNKLQELRKAEATLIAVRNAAHGVSDALNGIGKSQGILGKIGSGLGSFLGGAGGLLAGGVALYKVTDFFKSTVDEAMQAEEATARFKTQLENLGRADVFERLSHEADKLAKSVGYLDNDEVVGVFEKLIDYGKLTEKQIKELTPVIIDFAAKQRVDLATATDVITKALEGNAKGLKTFGINMKDGGDVAERFGIIMDDLKPKVDGAAKAFGETTEGQIKKTRQEIRDLQEDIGTKLLPAVKTFYQTVSGLISTTRSIFSSKLDEFLAAQEEKRQQQLKEFAEADRKRQAELLLQQKSVLQKILAEYKTATDEVTKRGLKKRFDAQLDLTYAFVSMTRTNQDTVLGTGNDLPTGNGTGAKVKNDIDELRKKYQEFSARTEEATLPILAAFRKINDQAQQDIQTVSDALKRGLITREDAEKAFRDIERVLNDQREALQKKFDLNPVRIPVVPSSPDMEGDMNKDAKEFGKEVFAKLQAGIKQQVQESKDSDPLQDWINQWGDAITIWANQSADIFMSISTMRANADQAAFEQEVANNDKRKASAQKLLDQKLISQKEYERRIATIDKQQAQREKELRKQQFEREKGAQTVQAVINGAQAVLATLSKFGAPIPPNFVGIAAMALTVATTAAQLTAIRSAKPPQFEQGGFIPQGSSHKQGGISLIDNRTGASLGEVEGGEPILSRKVYARNKPLIDSLLNEGGAFSINVPRINSSMQKMGYFADGGFIPSTGSDSQSKLLATLEALNQKLSQPAKAYVVYGDYEAKADRLSVIRAQSMVS